MSYSDSVRYRAVRHFKDARHWSFDEDQDRHLDGWFDHLREHAPDVLAQLITEAGPTNQEVLQGLLEYEGGEDQTTPEMYSCHSHNNKILAAAEKLGIVLDLSKTGRA